MLQKKHFYQNIFTETVTEKLVPESLRLQITEHNLYLKINFLAQRASIRYVIAKLSKFVKSACIPPQIPCYRGFFENLKGLGTNFQASFSTEFFDKTYSFVIFRKLEKFHYQTVIIFQVIQ